MPPAQSHGLPKGRETSLASPTSVATQVLSELVTTHRLKLTNTTEIPQSFRLLVSRPFSVAQDGASRSRRAPGRVQGCDEEPATAGQPLVLRPKENMLVSGHLPLTHARVHNALTHVCADIGIQTRHTLVSSTSRAGGSSHVLLRCALGHRCVEGGPYAVLGESGSTRAGCHQVVKGPFKTPQGRAPGWLSWLSVQLSVWAQALVSRFMSWSPGEGSAGRVRRRQQGSGLRFSLPLSQNKHLTSADSTALHPVPKQSLASSFPAPL